MRVTVAICTWNRAGLLDQTLARMRELRIPAGVEWELLVVDNNCTDHTDAVIAKHCDALPIRHIFEPTPGHTNARNRAIGEARGELILWTDDDVLVDTDWLAALVAAAQRHPAAGAFGGPIEPWFPTPPDPDLLAAFPALRRGMCGIDHELEEGVLSPDKMIFGANMVLRVSALRGLRFRTDLGARPVMVRTGGRSIPISIGGGDETNLIDRMRKNEESIIWVPSMKVLHYVDHKRMTINYLCKWEIENARVSIREQQIPEGATFLGVPRWILRQWALSWLKRWHHLLNGRRAYSLIWLRKWCVYHGIVLGCRDLGSAASRAI